MLRPRKARKSHQDSAVRFGTAHRGPERATKTRQYNWLRPEKSHEDSAVRFVMAKREPERATKTRQHDLLRPRVGQKESPRLGSTICSGQTCARKSHQDSAVRFGQKEPPRLGSTICYGQTWNRKSHRDSAIRFVTAKRGPERATKTRQYDLLRPRVGQKEPPRLGSTICCGQLCARNSHPDSAVRFVTAKRGTERAIKTVQKKPPRLGNTICYGQELARKSHRDSAIRFVTAKRGPERATKSRQYDLLREEWPQRATETRQYDLLRPNLGQKEPPRLGSTICYGQTWARKSHRDSGVRFVAAKSWPERATETRQCELLRLNLGQKEPPRLGSTICCSQTCARK